MKLFWSASSSESSYPSPDDDGVDDGDDGSECCVHVRTQQASGVLASWY